MMTKRKKMIQWAAAFDGEERAPRDGPPSLDAAGRAYVADLEQLRSGARTAAHAPEISEGQFGPFMAGICEGMERPEPRPAGLWAMASLSVAALVLVLSLLAIFSQGTAPVRATEVESAHTELEGVTVEFNNNEEVSTVWVTMPESDLW